MISIVLAFSFLAHIAHCKPENNTVVTESSIHRQLRPRSVILDHLPFRGPSATSPRPLAPSSAASHHHSGKGAASPVNIEPAIYQAELELTPSRKMLRARCSHFSYINTFEFPFKDDTTEIEAYVPKTNRQALFDSYPRLNVAGLAKCGTSTIFDILYTSLREIGWEAAGGRNVKEFCPRTGGYFGDAVKFLSGMQKIHSSAPTINGCLCTLCQMCIHELMRSLDYIQTDPIRYIITVRDPADRAWGTYNYWAKHFDKNFEFGGQHAGRDPKIFYRSPEMFHELVLSGDLIKYNNFGLHDPNNIDDGQWLPSDKLIMLRDLAGAGNLFVFDIDNLNITSLSAFVGVPVKMKLKNGNGHGFYSVSGNRPMLNATRQLIYGAARDDCVAVCDEFSICFSGCLQVAP